MVVTATDTPTQAEVLLLIEATSANGAYINELKTNYIIPTLEYFHGGPLEEGGGNGSVYGVVAYRTADCGPGSPVSTYGPLTCPQKTLETIDKIQYIGGRAESKACITEALSTALICFEEMGRTDVPRHILLLCCSPPYSAYGGGVVPAGCPATIEQAARLANERGLALSVLSARRSPGLLALYELSGGDLIAAQQRNYAKDPKHLVLLRGYSLKERPPSPAPPPAPEIQPDVYGPRGAAPPARPTAPFPPRARAAWLPPPRHPLYANNSALLTQLAQPSYPPPPPAPGQQHNTLQRNAAMLNQAGPSPVAPLPAPAPLAAAPQRTYIWSGVLEWMEKGKGPGDQQKITKHLPCQVSANSKDIEPELKVDTWPNKLLMQLMPKQLISNIGGQYLKDSKSVLFHLQPNEALDALTKVMVNGYAGCVHFSPMSSPPQCDIKVLILLYTPDKNAYLGFIPNNQATFVDRLRKVIQQQKMTQIINKQMPGVSSANPMGPGGMAPGMASGSMPGPSMSQGGGMGGGGMAGGSMAGGSMAGGGMGGSGMAGGGMSGGVSQLAPQSQGMQQQQMQHQQQNMMMGGGMQQQVQQAQQQAQQAQQAGGGKGVRGQVQLDGLEAARQQNLEKIHQLQQTLEAAHQQEAQFKSQLDIMSHLQAAQQQEQHYKQLEEQQRKHQLQQQLQQQQLRGGAGAGGGAGGGPGGGAGRGLRPMMPSNPGLRHLLQQQPQYRPSGPARPPSQTQQYDDVSNYSDFL